MNINNHIAVVIVRNDNIINYCNSLLEYIHVPHRRVTIREIIKNAKEAKHFAALTLENQVPNINGQVLVINIPNYTVTIKRNNVTLDLLDRFIIEVINKTNTMVAFRPQS